MAKIEIQNLSKDFTTPNGVLHAVKNASLTVNDGEVVVIIGPSGSGKSTMLRCVNGLEKPTSGHILIDGVDTTAPSTDIRKIREAVGTVLQSFNLFPDLVFHRLERGREIYVLSGAMLESRGIDVHLISGLAHLKRIIREKEQRSL